MKITPIGTRLLVQKNEPKEEKKTIILGLAKPDQHFATIISIGEGVDVKGLSVGQTIKHMPYGAAIVDNDNPNVLLIDQKDILAVVEE